MDNAPAQLLFRTSEGKLIKQYGNINPWALEILREITRGTGFVAPSPSFDDADILKRA